MATYKQIQTYIRDKHGYVVKTCWIAHVKHMVGLNPKQAPNRYDPNSHVYPCPPEKIGPIEEAFRHFRMI